MKFIPVETSNVGTWMIGFDNLNWSDYKNKCGCSYHVMGARLLQMEYPDYLRYLRSLGADLRGREGYVYAAFKDKKIVEKVCEQLNREWDKVKVYIEGK